MSPSPTTVPYNDWRRVAVPAMQEFVPELPVSVVIPFYRASPTSSERLARTLAALEGQTYPRQLFQVVIVDDGSEPPLACPHPTGLDVRVVRQERRGFDRARARNTGARAADHDILLFLDSDMLVERNWMMAHARWHHAVSDAMTLGIRSHVAVDDLGPEMIAGRSGSLEELLSDRPTDPPWVENMLAETDDLTSRIENPFDAMVGADFGMGKSFYEQLGGMDESFVRWGLEDHELGYRVYVQGGLLIPIRELMGWHQGRWSEDREAKRRSRSSQLGKMEHLMACRSWRRPQPGRIFAVPQYVVNLDGRRAPVDQVVRVAVDILADPTHDLVLRIETDAEAGDERLLRLQDDFGPEPRVRVAPVRSALDEFPASPFHIALPPLAFAEGLVQRLRERLGDAVVATAFLANGTSVSITRAWALNRARRTGRQVADFGEARTISARALKVAASVDGARRWSSRSFLGRQLRRALALARRTGDEAWRKCRAWTTAA